MWWHVDLLLLGSDGSSLMGGAECPPLPPPLHQDLEESESVFHSVSEGVGGPLLSWAGR